MKLLESYNELKGNKNLFLGFYGGGNYGDELLMEILMSYNEKNKINATFLYLNKVPYLEFHKFFLYSKIIYLKKFFIKSLSSKNIIFGGGGIFSEDSTYKHLLLLIYLFILKFIFFKKIYFFGLGFYKTTPFLKIIKFLVLTISEKIYVRDTSSFNLLGKNKKIILDNDLSFMLKENNFSSFYSDSQIFIKGIDLEKEKNIILFSFRPNNLDKKNVFEECMFKFIKNNSKIKFVFWKMMPNYFYNDFKNILDLKNVFILENTNPLDIFYFLGKYKDNFKIITPQFHGIITSYLLGINFFPIYYANKGKDLLNSFGLAGINIKNIAYNDIENFINK